MKSEFPDYKRISFQAISRSSGKDSKKREKFRRTMVSPEWSITRVSSVRPDEEKRRERTTEIRRIKRKTVREEGKLLGEFLGWQYLEEVWGVGAVKFDSAGPAAPHEPRWDERNLITSP